MTSEPPASPGAPPVLDPTALARLGITLVKTEHYHVGPYRYGTLADAVDEAKRDRAPGNDA